MKAISGPAIAVLFLGSMARADTIWTGAANTSALKNENVKIVSVAGGKVTYTLSSGSEKSKTMDQVQQISIDGETAFNAAEEAYAAKNYQLASTSYQSVAGTTTKDWIKIRAGQRLAVAGKALRRFDTEVAAYSLLIASAPADAASVEPSEPAENSPYLDPAITTLDKALTNSKLDKNQKASLLSLELKIYQAKKDSAKTTATLQQLVALGAASPSATAALKLASASVALDSKQYAQVISTIGQNKELFTEPRQQVDALFMLAMAKEGQDGSKTDADVLKDLAIAHMRVVTFGGDLPDHPHVAESLLHAAQLQEKLNDGKAALQLYEQVGKERTAAGSAVATTAAAAVERLSGTGKKPAAAGKTGADNTAGE